MNRFFVFWSSALLFGVSSLSATILTFDAPIPSGDVAISTQYGGFDWTNMYYMNPSPSFMETGYSHGMVSAGGVAYNGSGTEASVSGQVFNLNGAYLTGAWHNALNITITGYRDGVEMHSKSVVVDSDAPTYVTFDFLSIDEVTFESFGGTHAGSLEGAGTQFVVDDMSVTIVPEASNISLIAGLCMITCRCFRRKGK